MRLFVTILEDTPETALRSIAAIGGDHDGVEVRAERFGSFDPGLFRAATAKPLILTRRGLPFDPLLLRQAIEAGIDFVDVEYGTDLPHDSRERIVLSHHDFEGVGEMDRIAAEMLALDCGHTKIAITPSAFDDNLRLLSLLGRARGRKLTVIGMGERGLYSRILAPFRGSELAFVSPDSERRGAPAQLTLDCALAIYGPARAALRATHTFALAGNPAGHSLSPLIHNPLFREKGAAGAYGIASVAEFSELEEPLLGGELSGISVTAPFKRDAYDFALRRGSETGENARQCEAVNTLVRTRGKLVADNTDVDGFNFILARLCGRDRKSVALVGAGGTARAALVALGRAGMHVTLFSRTPAKGRGLAERFGVEWRPLGELPGFDGEIVINALPADAPVPIAPRPGMAWVESAYGADSLAARHDDLRAAGVDVHDGLELLEAQAVRQNELFMKAFDDQR